MFVNGKIILVACVASVSAQVRRESWNEGAKKRDDNFRAITLSEKLAIRRISFWLNLNVYFYSLKTQTWSTTLVSCVTATTIREPLSTLLMFSSKGCGLSSTNIGNPRWNENRSKIHSPGTITPENCTPRAYLRSSLHEGRKLLAPRRS